MNYTGLCTPQVEEKLVALNLKPAQQKALIYLMMSTPADEPDRVMPTKFWGQICASNTTVWRALSLMSDMSIDVDGNAVRILDHVTYDASAKTLSMQLSKEFMTYCTRIQ